ncbi:Alpha-D-ribose 1-methylphosphonate 5-triphosphate diphosphatase [Thalassovita gelatinovora]|uniref:Alpha-D-ribose 1-methylphosphonate 5-triphosphate diphosphatase n=1 Tax=Thalassovita gelatinovora TaxID=53501 RepID=A0A0P1FUI5_THAGE|nr:alpha-D-ribose 1-methylphosphonate 5-triphosphate diphosphatase [Thalassovita gelatinovora]QIZ80057.1 alpha-D-ribose 1-methylphosphonate 5-triphosphate diphosphatase [Thalassovita gelatinovora]CUH65460.1 Alpha-D-ribose 1-methylphosphonate 5-triphosphate diphosphatase [Thalassovita gelatinovora]SER09306.1 alpha-D-ribose 1-methylphosphonate 5-triphosphate diphosphatase [Thalassovita gelatinovora]
MTRSWKITGGEPLWPEGFAAGPLHVCDGRIVEHSQADTELYDASGSWVLPGIIDLHGDAFEAVVQPRPGVHFPYDLAYAEADRQMISNGITTGYHALTISWEPGLRDIRISRALLTALDEVTHKLTCDTWVNIRWETFAIDHVDEVIGWLAARPGDILSINDHTSANHKLGEDSAKLKRMAVRMGLSPADAKAEIAAVWDRRNEVPEAIDRICAEAAALGRPALSHDDASRADRRTGRARRLTVAEFPTTEEAAREARDAGEHVILGGPNALRGLSHNGALCATQAIRDGLCTVLASDYYYPAPFHAAFRLSDEGILPLAEAWALVSENPAAAVGLTDRGDLSIGKRADILVVNKETRKIQAVFVEGRKVLDRA